MRRLEAGYLKINRYVTVKSNSRGLLFYTAVFVICCCTVLSNAGAAEVYLKNGDRITGEVLEDTPEAIKVQTEFLGLLTVGKGSIDRVADGTKKEEAVIEPQVPVQDAVLQEKAPDDPSLWKREISVGYNKSSGNTVKDMLSVSAVAKRKNSDNELILKFDSYYASSNKEIDAQRYSSLIHYGIDFKDSSWYYFYKMEAEHDRFANIDYRLVPSLGVGRRFNEKYGWNVLTEAGFGLEHTDFRDGSGTEDDIILVSRLFLERDLWQDSKISQDVLFYPNLTETGEYRLNSETVFTNPIDENLSLNLKLIDSYNSNPATGSKENDFRIISSLMYSF